MPSSRGADLETLARRVLSAPARGGHAGEVDAAPVPDLQPTTTALPRRGKTLLIRALLTGRWVWGMTRDTDAHGAVLARSFDRAGFRYGPGM